MNNPMLPKYLYIILAAVMFGGAVAWVFNNVNFFS